VKKRRVEVGIYEAAKKWKEENEKSKATNITKEYRCTRFIKSLPSIKPMNTKTNIEKTWIS